MSIVARIRGDNLWARCVRACGWITISSMSSQFLRMLRLWILAFWLLPGDLFVWGIVWSVLVLLREFFDTGVMHALIQSPRGLEKNYLDTAWWINAARNGILVGVLLLAAPLIATHYRKPEMGDLIRLITLVLIFDGLTSVGPLVLRKQLLFRRVAGMEIASNALAFGVAIAVGYRWGGLLALVLGEVTVSATRCILSYMVHAYRPGLRCDRAAARALLGFGFMAYLVALVNVLAMRADVLLLGSVAGATTSGDAAGGCYVLGMILIMAPAGMFGLLSVSVGFPALSSVQHDLLAVRRGTTEMMKGGLLVAVPLFAVLGLLAHDILQVLPVRFAPAGQSLRWLSVFGISLVFVRQMSPALYAIRKVHWCVIRGILCFVLIATLIVPMYRRWGLTGACWATNTAIIAGNIFLWPVMLHELKWPWRQWFADLAVLWRAAISGGVAFACAYACLSAAGYDWTSYAWARFLICGAALLGYGAACWTYYHKGRSRSIDSVTEELAVSE